ncbi:helix-turn-helix domain-containing protein [Streptomyces sp. NBC_01725]|uniref:helix-turn-helix domain-containing protein n=1 Tax=Streptomyces sp. NBC_01725 TaxID=2975923 RepID=UPI002E2BB446|nr:helix-turn-helix transcriptional regulator [Streptomyces sp. NBC_01725]
MAYRLRVNKLRAVARNRGDRTGYAIAKRTGLHESTVSRLLRGQQQPGANTLLLLARVYGTDFEDLIDTTQASAAEAVA